MYNRYFKCPCDENDEPIAENIVEIPPPMQLAIFPFCVGILIGCILMIIF